MKAKITAEDRTETVRMLEVVVKDLGTTYCCRVLKCSLTTLKGVLAGEPPSDAFILKLRPFYRKVKGAR
jgi:hypothetical protein